MVAVPGRSLGKLGMTSFSAVIPSEARDLSSQIQVTIFINGKHQGTKVTKLHEPAAGGEEQPCRSSLRVLGEPGVLVFFRLPPAR